MNVEIVLWTDDLDGYDCHVKIIILGLGNGTWVDICNDGSFTFGRYFVEQRPHEGEPYGWEIVR